MRNRILDRLAALSEWADGASWRTWLLHGLIALPIAWAAGAVLWVVGAPFGLGYGLAVLFYVVRELEQIAHQLMWMDRLAEPWYDYVLDVIAPAVACALVSSI